MIVLSEFALPLPFMFYIFALGILHFVVKKVKEHFLCCSLMQFRENIVAVCPECLFVSGACLTVSLALQSQNSLQLPDCTRTVWRAGTLQYIFPKSLNRDAFPQMFCFSPNLAQRERAVIARFSCKTRIYYASIWQWFSCCCFFSS